MLKKHRTFAAATKTVVNHSVGANGNRSRHQVVSLFYRLSYLSAYVACHYTAAVQKDFSALRGATVFVATGRAAVPVLNRLRKKKDMNEIWKDIEGYEGLYQVSNMGRVRNFRGHVLYQRKQVYLTVELVRNCRRKKFSVHRLVARAFVKGYAPMLQVNHKDENKQNNRAENLEWVTAKQNMNYGTRTERASASNAISCGMPVEMYDKEGVLLRVFPSAIEASRVMCINRGNIQRCLTNPCATAGGYRWRRKENTPQASPNKEKLKYDIQILDGEEWRDVLGFEGRYMISNFGRVASLINSCFRILRPSVTDKGRLQIGLYQKGGVVRHVFVHRLVAVAFVKGYQDGYDVNHIDENPQNNKADNLEWLPRRENLLYGTGPQRRAASRSRPVIQLTLSGNFVAEYPSIKAAALAIGGHKGRICNCARGNSKTYYGYLWRYKK